MRKQQCKDEGKNDGLLLEVAQLDALPNSIPFRIWTARKGVKAGNSRRLGYACAGGGGVQRCW